MKLHALVDGSTNMILAWELTDPHEHDSRYLPKLLDHLHHPVGELYADAGYFSRENCWAVQAAGGTPYIRPHVTARPAPPPNEHGRHKTAFDAMMWRYQTQPEAWLRRYRRRNRIEGIFSALKRRLGASLRSLRKRALRLEALLKVVVWNLLCVKPTDFRD